MTTRDDAIAAAGRALATAVLTAEQLPVDELVEACWTPTGPTREQLRERITRERALRDTA